MGPLTWMLLTATVLVTLTACRIEINAPAYGSVTTESGDYQCRALGQCTIPVVDTNFDETFVAVPREGYQFIGWKKGFARLCGGSLSPCHIATGWFADHDNMMALLESDAVGYLAPDFIPTDAIRRYQAGDFVVFSGVVSVTNIGESPRESPVRVRQDFLPGRKEYLDKAVLTLRTTTTYLATGEQQVTEKSIWQENNGELFELTDDYGNDYVTGDAFTKGLISIPVPLTPLEEHTVDFYTMFGGTISGPITEGSRDIAVDELTRIATPLGEYPVYPLRHNESFIYFFTYVDNKSGTRVAIDRDLWVSPAKGLVKKIERRREYSRSGTLQSETRWELEAARISF